MGLVEMMMVGTLVFVFVIAAGVFASLYQKCGSNEAMIISGYGFAEPRVFTGVGCMVLPVFQNKAIVSLEVMSIELKSTTSYTSSDNTVYDFDGVVEAAIGSSEQQIKSAVQSFGTKDIRDIRSIIYDIVQDAIRKSISKNNDTNIANTNLLTEEIKMTSSEELRRYGIEIHGLRVREVRPVKRTKAIESQDSSSSLSQADAVSSNGNLTGTMAVVSKVISNDEPGEITYKIANSSQRIVLPAKQKIPGKALECGSPVIIQEVQEEFALVDPWTDVYLHYPSSAN